MTEAAALPWFIDIPSFPTEQFVQDVAVYAFAQAVGFQRLKAFSSCPEIWLS